jgi:hypothetical protein
MSHGLFSGLLGQRTTSAPPVAADRFAPPVVAPPELAASVAVDRSFELALDALPCNAMFCDRELILRYLNRPRAKHCAP